MSPELEPTPPFCCQSRSRFAPLARKKLRALVYHGPCSCPYPAIRARTLTTKVIRSPFPLQEV